MADYPVSITQLSTSDARAQAIADIVGELRDEAIKQTAAQQLIALGLSGGTGEVKEWKALRNVLRSGLIRKLLAVGDQLLVEKESGLSVTVNGNVTAATVNEETFVSATGHAGERAYEFVFDGAAWHLEGSAVELAHYGITITSTPQEGDAVVVHEAASQIVFDVLDFDYDHPVNADLEYSLSLLTHAILLYSAIAFSAAQALISIRADQFPDGLVAGQTYYLHGDHCCYDNTTKQDDDYSFTPTKAVPVGGKVRHSEIGKWYSNASDYTVAKVLSGTWTTYDADYNVIEQGLPTAQGSTGTLIGTVTAIDPQYRATAWVNFGQRNMYGSNRNAHSANRKWLNSDAPAAGSGAIASWWEASDEFDMPIRSTLPGFLHGIDPTFRAVIAKVYKRTALGMFEGNGYEDTEEYVWQPSMTEVGFGNNNNVVETSPLADGTTGKITPYAFYVGATNKDRIKFHNGTARYWWLRSPYPSYYAERGVAPGGALNYNGPHYSNGVVAGLCIA